MNRPAGSRNPRGLRDVTVDPSQRPGWMNGSERPPIPGERVHTVEGSAVVVRVAGRTGSGDRLLELSIDDGRKHPFFAAAANVLVAPAGVVVEASDPSATFAVGSDLDEAVGT